MTQWQIELLFIVLMGFATPFLIFWYATAADDIEVMLEPFFWGTCFWAGVFFLAKWWFIWR